MSIVIVDRSEETYVIDKVNVDLEVFVTRPNCDFTESLNGDVLVGCVVKSIMALSKIGPPG